MKYILMVLIGFISCGALSKTYECNWDTTGLEGEPYFGDISLKLVKSKIENISVIACSHFGSRDYCSYFNNHNSEYLKEDNAHYFSDKENKPSSIIIDYLSKDSLKVQFNMSNGHISFGIQYPKEIVIQGSDSASCGSVQP